MPHITIEYSRNLAEKTDIQGLAKAVHQAALATGVFPLGGTRTRAVARETYVIADGDPTHAFVHTVLRIGQGRDQETKRRAGQAVFDAVCVWLRPVAEVSGLALSLEVQETDAGLSFKQNNLHERVKAARVA